MDRTIWIGKAAWKRGCRFQAAGNQLTGDIMYKKLLIPLTLALVAALGFSGVAYAAGASATRIRFTGTILRVIPTAQRFEIEESNTGALIVIRVAEGTVYKGLAGSIGELKPAMRVVVIATPHKNGDFEALSVNVLRLKFKGEINGTVTMVAAKSFTIQGTNGLMYSFRVNKSTKFSGQGVTSFTGLKVGMAVRVDFTDLKSGVLRAVDVTVR